MAMAFSIESEMTGKGIFSPSWAWHHSEENCVKLLSELLPHFYVARLYQCHEGKGSSQLIGEKEREYPES